MVASTPSQRADESSAEPLVGVEPYTPGLVLAKVGD
jgi:hypothetical protein